MVLPLTACQKWMPLPIGGSIVTDNRLSVSSTGNKIIILAGQSNMVGRGQSQQFDSHDRVSLTRDMRTGPGYYAGARLADAYPNWKITLVECAAGSTQISQWVQGGDHFLPCIQAVRDEQAKGGDVIGMMFYQGESDARENFNPNWPNMFENMCLSFRNEFGKHMPIVWAQIGLFDTRSQEVNANWNQFKKNQLTVMMPDSAMVKTEDQPVVDDVHHDYWANQAIGERFYRAYLNLIVS